MFDIAPSELLLTAIVAIVVIGPKDMPLALRTAGRWIGKMRRMSNHLRSGFEAMIREAEMEEMERKWREQNEAILAAHPAASAEPAMLPLASAIDYPVPHPASVPTMIEPSTIEQPTIQQPTIEQPAIAQALGDHGPTPSTQAPPWPSDAPPHPVAGALLP